MDHLGVDPWIGDRSESHEARPTGSGRRLPSATARARRPRPLLVAAVALGATTVGPLVLTAADRRRCARTSRATSPVPDGRARAAGDPDPRTPTATPGDPTATPGGAMSSRPPPPPTSRIRTDKPDPNKPDPTHKPKPHPELLGLRLSNVDGRGQGRLDHLPSPRIRRLQGRPVDRREGQLAARPERHARRGRPHPRRTALVDDGAPRRHQGLVSRVLRRPDRPTATRSSAAPRAKSIVRHETAGAEARARSGLEAKVTDGGVVLDWGACSSDVVPLVQGRPVARGEPVVRPLDRRQPADLLHRGPRAHPVHRLHVESGQTWFYRIQAVGFSARKKVLLGQTAAIEVTIP